jgi:hypothetical protein
MTWAFDQELPPKPKVVLLALANRADRVTGMCFPGLDLLSRETSVPKRSLMRHLYALQRNGYIRIEKTRDDHGRQRNNTYYLQLDRNAAEWGEWMWTRPEDEVADAVDGPEPDVVDDDGNPDGTEETDVTPGAMMAPGESEPSTCGKVPGAECHGDRVPSAIGGTPQTSSEPKSTTTDSQTRTPAVGFSRKAQDEAIERERIRELAAKASARTFVFENSDAWRSWCAYRKRTTGVGSLPVTTAEVDGKRRRGWYLPSLYPPNDGSATGPPPQAAE